MSVRRMFELLFYLIWVEIVSSFILKFRPQPLYVITKGCTGPISFHTCIFQRDAIFAKGTINSFKRPSVFASTCAFFVTLTLKKHNFLVVFLEKYAWKQSHAVTTSLLVSPPRDKNTSYPGQLHMRPQYVALKIKQPRVRGTSASCCFTSVSGVNHTFFISAELSPCLPFRHVLPSLSRQQSIAS